MREKENTHIRLVCIVGPTAVGKTAVGIKLAEKIGGEIISADSMAVYRGMDIGTAKPTPKEQACVKFHLIDIVDPDDPFTVKDFADLAKAAVDDCLSRGVYPILLGGTGLYVRAVVDGLDIPQAGPDEELREELLEYAGREGNEALHAKLAEVDPETAQRLHPNDLKRVIRALEVFKLSGKPISKMHEAQKSEPNYPEALIFGLEMDRERLYQRIEERVDLQIQQGLIEEVGSLVAKGYDERLPALQGLGYKEIIGYLRGGTDLDTAVNTLKQSTRRFAKRQFTWFRADRRVRWINMDNLDAETAADLIAGEVRGSGEQEK